MNNVDHLIVCHRSPDGTPGILCTKTFRFAPFGSEETAKIGRGEMEAGRLVEYQLSWEDLVTLPFVPKLPK